MVIDVRKLCMRANSKWKRKRMVSIVLVKLFLDVGAGYIVHLICEKSVELYLSLWSVHSNLQSYFLNGPFSSLMFRKLFRIQRLFHSYLFLHFILVTNVEIILALVWILINSLILILYINYFKSYETIYWLLFSL